MFKKLPIFGIFFLFFFFVGLKPLYASTLSLTPASGKIGLGQTISVQVRINAAGDPVNGVSAFLSYPTDKLEVVSVRYGSSFPYGAEASGAGGVVKISAGSLNGVGSGSVGFITFRGKALGTATVAFIGGSQAPRFSDSSDSLNLGGSTGGTFTIVDAKTLPSVTPGAQDKVTDVQAVDVASTSATITWKTTTKLNSIVEYGLDNGVYFLTASNDTLSTDHKVTLNSSLLVPGLLVNYRVKSQSKDGSISAVGENLTLQLVGYTVMVHLTDTSKKPLVNTAVTLYSQTKEATTDAQGQVVFTNVSPGTHLLAIKTNDTFQIHKVTVADADVTQPQRFDFELTPAQTQTSSESLNPLLLALGVLLTIAPLVVLYLLKRESNPAPESQFPEQL